MDGKTNTLDKNINYKQFMQYLGSKSKLSKHILPLILEGRKPNQYYVELFVGGCNSIDKVENPRIGCDNNFYLIEMWKALQNGWIPPSFVSKETYYEVKANQDNYQPHLVSFISFLCSFGGKWWGGYAFNNRGDNYAARAVRVLLKQIPKLQGVDFIRQDYSLLDIPPNSIIYCDPPYGDTTTYGNTPAFNYNKFWEWARIKSMEHRVFVSEYNAPDDFECIKTVEHKTILDKNTQKKRVEKLFIYKDAK